MATDTAPRKAAANRAAAARAEKNQPKKVTFRGIELGVVPEQPKTLNWDIAAAKTDFEFLQLVQSLVLPEDHAKVREGIEAAKDIDKFYEDLLVAVVGAYGADEGESSASEDS